MDPKCLVDVKYFSWDQLSNVPNDPGIYAWYIRPELRKADLHNYDLTRDNLLRLAKNLRIPDLEMDAKGHLSLGFSGTLEHLHLANRSDDKITSHVEKILGDDKRRFILSAIFGHAAPILMAPIYIGVAIDLNDRINQHRRDMLTPNPTNDSYSFAEEIKRRDITTNKLILYTCSVPDIGKPGTLYTKEEIRETVEALETILNRIFYPILGRR